MGRYKIRFMYFMDRYFYDQEHFYRYMEANNLGFAGSGAFAEFQFTRVEFDLAYERKRTRLPSGDRLEWHSVTKIKQRRIWKLRNMPFGYQEDNRVILADAAINFILHAPERTFYSRSPLWFCTGLEWGHAAAAIYKPALLQNWLRKEWKDDLIIRFGLTPEDVFNRIHHTFQDQGYNWGYSVLRVLK